MLHTFLGSPISNACAKCYSCFIWSLFSILWRVQIHYGPGVDSASNRNEHQEYFLGINAAGAYGWPYHLHVPIVLKSGSLNLLEPSGPVQVCNGITLPLPSSGGHLRYTSDSIREKRHHTPLSHNNPTHYSNQCREFTSITSITR